MRGQIAELLKKTNEKRLKQLIAALMAGVVLMLASNMVDNKEPSKEDTPPAIEDIADGGGAGLSDYENRLESKLSKILSEVEGVGRVSVFITISHSSQVELAQDTSYEKIETGDLEGGIKESVTEKKELKHVLVQGKDGFNEPVIIKQIEPKIEGVIIVAEGGNNAAIKAQLTNAAGALLNLPVHKIEVLKMKEE